MKLLRRYPLITLFVLGYGLSWIEGNPRTSVRSLKSTAYEAQPEAQRRAQ